ncbi:MAG: hypothetical protein AB1551_07380 [Actinomycetota bacterium]
MMLRIRRDDGGFALVGVLLALGAVLLLLAGVLSYALGSQNLSRHDQDWNAALSGAEAGIDDYLFHLNQDGAYWQYSATNPPPDGNQAFATWVPVPGASSDASYRYDIDTSELAVDGTVKVIATGRVGNVTRTVEASLRRRNFLDFLYFTEYETTDPANSNVYTGSGGRFSTTVAQQYCAKHYYDGRDIDGRVDFAGDTDPDYQYCFDITFIGVDNIDGPLHTNDALRIYEDPHFNGDTSTSYQPTSGDPWVCAGSPCAPVFKPGDPEYAAALTMPPSNVDLKNETDPVLGGTGCLFTGPTAIRLNSDGTMDVISPFSKVVNCTWPANPTTSMFQRYTITRFTIPSDGGVVYTQNVPSVTSDPNYTNGCPFNREAIGGTGSSNPNRTHPVGFPQRYDITPGSSGMSTTGYGCRNGDVFIQGTLNGRLTVAAENNIFLFGSTTYNAGDELLGLVANNYINVYHPVSSSDQGSSTRDGSCDGGCNLRLPGTSSTSTTPSLFNGTTPGTSGMATATGQRALRGPVFNAALLTVAHSFQVQNYTYGPPFTDYGGSAGNLSVFGAIAQQYRGAVGTFGWGTLQSGYAKAYSYDNDLTYDSPPHFLNPVASAWQVVTWAERKAAHSASES